MANEDIDVTLRLRNARRFQKDAKDSESAISGIGRGAKGVGVGIGNLAKSALKFGAVTAGITGVGAALAKVTSDTVGFDTAMRNVNSIARLNETQFGGLEKQVLRLAGPTAQAPETLAQGLYDLVSSGFDAHQSLVILKASARAATAGLTDTATSVGAVAAVLNAYHLRAKDASDVSDILFQTVNRGVITFEDLASQIGDVLPFSAALGVGLPQVGAAIATMTKEGINSAETMTRIKNVMQAFIKPGKGMTKALKDLGVSSGEALIKQKGFQGALEAVIGSTNGSKAAIAKIFPNIRALGGALALTGKNAKTAHGDLKAFADTHGATGKALAEQQKSLSFQWRRFNVSLKAAYIQVGLKLLPAATKLLPKVSKFVQELQTGQGAGGRFARSMASLGRSIGGLIGAIGQAVRAVMPLIRGLGPAIAQTFRGLAGIIKGLVEVITGVLTFKFATAWTGVKDIFHGGLNSLIGQIRAFTTPARHAAAALGGAIASGIKGAFGGIVSFLAARLNNVIDVINAAIGAFNALPGHHDIGKIPHVGSPGGGGAPHVSPTPTSGPTPLGTPARKPPRHQTVDSHRSGFRVPSMTAAVPAPAGGANTWLTTPLEAHLSLDLGGAVHKTVVRTEAKKKRRR